jgi:hypothetical protein
LLRRHDPNANLTENSRKMRITQLSRRAMSEAGQTNLDGGALSVIDGATHFMIKHLLASVVIVGSVVGGAALPAAWADFPKPSVYPVSWELKFTHGVPKRVVVNVPGVSEPKAYWYLTYEVMNSTDREMTFLPVFQMLTQEGKVVRSDNGIPGKVLEVIRTRENNPNLMSMAQIGGTLRIGEDQAKDGMAVWEEIPGRAGQFSVFVQGLSGETANVKGPDGKEVTLRKTLQLNYLIRGDEVYPGEDQVNENPSRWVMR